MIRFQTLFGLPPSQIHPHCVILPSHDLSAFPHVKITSKGHGNFFSVANAKSISFLITRYNLLMGDCVLSLKETPCRNIYLFGPCGGLAPRQVGDMVILENALNFESFSDMLEGGRSPHRTLSDDSLTKRLAAFGKGKNLTPATGATVSSLILEEEQAGALSHLKLSCLDMEASIVFSAARHIHRPAAALFYVSDTVAQKPAHASPQAKEKARLAAARKSLAGLLIDFIKDN